MLSLICVRISAKRADETRRQADRSPDNVTEVNDHDLILVPSVLRSVEAVEVRQIQAEIGAFIPVSTRPNPKQTITRPESAIGYFPKEQSQYGR